MNPPRFYLLLIIAVDKLRPHTAYSLQGGGARQVPPLLPLCPLPGGSTRDSCGAGAS